MYARKRILLRLVDLAGASATRLQLLSWAFLLSRRSSQIGAFYHFLPFGDEPFSFTLHHEVDALVKNGLVSTPSSCQLRLTPIGKDSLELEDQTQQEIDRFWSDCGGLPTTDLEGLVRSEGERLAASRRPAQREEDGMSHADWAIYTVGYEGMQVDGLLDLLQRSGITCILDVRRNPISRRFGFSKNTLARLCGVVGIRYEHIPEVGVPSEWRSDLDSKSDYSRLFDRYRRKILPNAEPYLSHMVLQVRSEPSVLLCQEADPGRCHRSILARCISRTSGLPVVDLR